ncbi:hypothetical protein ACLOJK_010669 [Asimina triloba]
MVESDFDAESCGGSAAGDARTEIHAPVLRREPSFSRWCDEDVIERSRQSSEEASASAAVEDGEFELPLLHVEGHMNGGSDMEQRNHGGMKYAPFSVEDQSGKRMRYMGLRCEGGKWERPIDAVQTAQSHISLATLLRTLLYILVWYTFSTIGVQDPTFVDSNGQSITCCHTSTKMSSDIAWSSVRMKFLVDAKYRLAVEIAVCSGPLMAGTPES